MLAKYINKSESIIDQLTEQIKKLKTSRATPALVEDIIVNVYGGTKMRIKELASITVPEPRTILINPWDKNTIKNIEKGIVNSNLEFNPIIDNDVLRIQLPELTQETREKLVKQLSNTLEEYRIKIRKIRDEIKKEIENKHKEGEIGEDDKFKLIDKLNEETRKYLDRINEIGENKKEDIMTI